MSVTNKNQSTLIKADRLGNIGVSEILQITERARLRKAEGRPVLVLGAGEPDFETPDNVKQAAIEAIQRGDTHYTALDGTSELKDAIRQKFRRDNQLEFAANEVMASAGAKQTLYNAFMATLSEGDEVIIPTPYWTSYSDIVEVCGGKPVLVQCREENGFLLDADDLDNAIGERTRWLLLNSPSNPTGAAYGREEYGPILDVLKRHPEVWLMVDDIYEHIVYDDFEFVTACNVDPEIASRTLIINGVSKAYAMTGWRLGYAAGPASLIGAMKVMQSQSTSCPSSITQAAAVEALTGPQEFLADRRASFEARRNLVTGRLNSIKGIRCPIPRGAFYTYADCSALIGKHTADGERISSDSDFCRLLLEQSDVAIVPGSVFGLSPYFRISYATSEDILSEALQRIEQFVASLS